MDSCGHDVLGYLPGRSACFGLALRVGPFSGVQGPARLRSSVRSAIKTAQPTGYVPSSLPRGRCGRLSLLAPRLGCAEHGLVRRLLVPCLMLHDGVK
eukprot:6667180-Pyramimonas_sp.AAC.1